MDNLQYVLMEEGDVVLVDNYQVRERVRVERDGAAGRAEREQEHKAGTEQK
jgi:hypothetical protein